MLEIESSVPRTLPIAPSRPPSTCSPHPRDGPLTPDESQDGSVSSSYAHVLDLNPDKDAFGGTSNLHSSANVSPAVTTAHRVGDDRDIHLPIPPAIVEHGGSLSDLTYPPHLTDGPLTPAESLDGNVSSSHAYALDLAPNETALGEIGDFFARYNVNHVQTPPADVMRDRINLTLVDKALADREA